MTASARATATSPATARVVYYDYDAGMYFVCRTIPGAPGTESRHSCPRFDAGGSGTPPWGWITNNPGNPFTGLHGLSLPGPFAAANNNFDAGVADPTGDGVPNAAASTRGNLSFDDSAC